MSQLESDILSMLDECERLQPVPDTIDPLNVRDVVTSILTDIDTLFNNITL